MTKTKTIYLSSLQSPAEITLLDLVNNVTHQYRLKMRCINIAF